MNNEDIKYKDAGIEFEIANEISSSFKEIVYAVLNLNKDKINNNNLSNKYVVHIAITLILVIFARSTEGYIDKSPKEIINHIAEAAKAIL